MCADIEIVTSNQYDGASAAHSELDRPAPRLRSALPRPHVRVDGSPPAPTEPGGSGSSGGGGLRGGSALPPDLLLDGPPRTTRLPAHGVRGQAQRAKGSVSIYRIFQNKADLFEKKKKILTKGTKMYQYS